MGGTATGSLARVHRPELQGLRAVAVTLVVVYHVWFGRVSGGVDVFFVVSGFLLTLNGSLQNWLEPVLGSGEEEGLHTISPGVLTAITLLVVGGGVLAAYLQFGRKAVPTTPPVAPPVAPPAQPEIPISGAAVPGMAAYDQTITAFMRKHAIPGGAVAVLRDGIACKPAVLAETDDWVAMASEFRSLANLPGVDQAKIWEPEPAVVYSWHLPQAA